MNDKTPEGKVYVAFMSWFSLLRAYLPTSGVHTRPSHVITCTNTLLEQRPAGCPLDKVGTVTGCMPVGIFPQIWDLPRSVYDGFAAA